MPNKVYHAPETSITFKETGGSVTFTPKNITTGAGRVSAQWDRGAGSKPGLYKWRAKTAGASAATVGRVVEILFATSDGTIVDGDFGTTDAGMSDIDYKRNCQWVGNVAADDSQGAGTNYNGSGVVEILDRYVSVVWWNDLGVSLTNTAGDHEFTLTPVPMEIQ
jgi:hypothetical protein